MGKFLDLKVSMSSSVLRDINVMYSQITENDLVHSKHAVSISCHYYKELKGSMNYIGSERSGEQ